VNLDSQYFKAKAGVRLLFFFRKISGHAHLHTSRRRSEALADRVRKALHRQLAQKCSAEASFDREYTVFRELST